MAYELHYGPTRGRGEFVRLIQLTIAGMVTEAHDTHHPGKASFHRYPELDIQQRLQRGGRTPPPRQQARTPHRSFRIPTRSEALQNRYRVASPLEDLRS